MGWIDPTLLICPTAAYDPRVRRGPATGAGGLSAPEPAAQEANVP